MREPRPLSGAQREAFRRDGFVELGVLFARQELQELRKLVDELCAGPERPGGPMVYRDEAATARGETLISRIEYARPFSPGLARWMESERVCAPVAAVLDEPVRLFKDKLNLKPPGGSGFAAHQDAQAEWDRYCATQVSVAIFVDEVSAQSGALELAPRRRPELLGARGRPLSAAEQEGLRYRRCEGPPGTALLFDAFAPHRSAPNHSRRPRRLLYWTYNPASQGDHYQRYFADKRAAFPPDVERPPGAVYRYRV